MNLYKVSVVSYLNSTPFTFGLRSFDFSPFNVQIEEDIPSVCAQKLMDGRVDIGLVPSAIIPQLRSPEIISDYCIGATGPVQSVMLYSHVPLQQIQKILLDYQSRTSVALVKILAEHYWKINPEWENGSPGFEKLVNDTTAAVVIGDRTFELNKIYPYKFDLAEAWFNLTRLPFVFACWVSTQKINPEFIDVFNKALKSGISQLERVVQNLPQNYLSKTATLDYLSKNISFSLDNAKKQGLNRFLSMLKK